MRTFPMAAQCQGAHSIVTTDEHGLAAITRPDVQAVIYVPPAVAWLAEIAEAVETRQILIDRVVLPNVSRGRIAEWLERQLPAGIVSEPARTNLRDDVLGLVDRLSILSGATRFMLRIFTEAPTTECGFHVDT